MTVNELRRSNVVVLSEDNSLWVVNGIHEFGIDVVNPQEDETYIEIDQFEGLKITPQLLEEVGFTEVNKGDNDFTWWACPDHDYYLCIDWRKRSLGYKLYPNTGHELESLIEAVHYFHHLQNIHYAITGEELSNK